MLSVFGISIPDFWQLVIGLLGGLSFFLFGLELLTASLKKVAEERMRFLLQKLTNNRFMAVATGAFVTSVIQSSSVTTVLVVSFISAGVMNLGQSVGVIMGANIGTTLTAQIVAFKVTEYALALIVVGFLFRIIGSNSKSRALGTVILGLGLIFFGMDFMSQATEPLRSYPPFIDAMSSMSNPFYGVAVAAFFTALVQSSSATTGIVIVLASQGFITLEAGIVLALGANVGTCVTALLAAIGKRREALQAAIVHVLFNVLGVLLWIFFVDFLAELVRGFSFVSTELSGTERLAAETPRQIANAHTFFNIANTCIFIWFTGPLSRLVEWLVPLKKERDFNKSQYLEKSLLKTPFLAVNALCLELNVMGGQVKNALGGILLDDLGSKKDFSDELKSLRHSEAIYQAITLYVPKVLARPLSKRTSKDLSYYLLVANNFKNIADTLKFNVIPLLEEWRECEGGMSASTRADLGVLAKDIRDCLEKVLQALEKGDGELALDVIDLKSKIKKSSEALLLKLGICLANKDRESIRVYQIEVSFIELLKRLYYFVKSSAKAVSGCEFSQWDSHEEDE